ncbi:hypothetical protein DSO57_1002994 [Entomophthora muscae]|uniref:Uncharacterized protein n=1 Tax=Entomophthora muscae TaxID=34485 RepID=A0ACC2SXR5_9FUNG|nr:hypothetical protein DSO57_1002994 [Entomophthora muscae]
MLRLQKLNLIGAKTRTKFNYIEKLYTYHAQQKTCLRFVTPVLRKTVDLYQLKVEVQDRGGEHEVTKDKKWAEIGEALGYTSRESKRIAESLKLLSENLITPYETYLGESYPTPSSPQNPVSCCDKCETDNDKPLIKCKDCKRVYHLGCLKPPMKTAPNSNWSCATCLDSLVQDFGFASGKKYSLCSFKRQADSFKNRRFMELKTLERAEAENLVEKEFWRLVDSPSEAVTVEYGADLHCPDYSSGFPTDPSDPLSKHPWNLTVLPSLPTSLLSWLPSDISGMTVPWVYAGMCLSTFCWHNEDHYTYSVNYHHLGDTKTWYSVPGGSAAAFERAMEEEVPELFRKQPDLLFHLSTLISPADLVKHNVPVYATDQRAGQFVITFPQAYHAGFNHGFNFNEAVNFAGADWLPFGRACVDRYSRYNWIPVFSHHELLCIAAPLVSTPSQAKLLLDEFEKMNTSESSIRTKAKFLVGTYKNVAVASTQQCVICHQYCFLSSFTCQCDISKDRVACITHLPQLCNCPIEHKVFQIHFESSKISTLISKLKRLKVKRNVS